MRIPLMITPDNVQPYCGQNSYEKFFDPTLARTIFLLRLKWFDNDPMSNQSTSN